MYCLVAQRNIWNHQQETQTLNPIQRRRAVSGLLGGGRGYSLKQAQKPLVFFVFMGILGE